MDRKNKICGLVLSGLIFYPFLLFSQQPAVQMLLDKRTILIGEQFKYIVKAVFPYQYKVQWPDFPDSIYHFEVVNIGKIDSLSERNNNVLQQTITFTSFDSGAWKTPSFLFTFVDPKGSKPVKVYTDSVLIKVGYSPPDSTNQLRDIKPIREVTITNYTWYYIAGGLILLILLGLLLWRYFKNKRKKPKDVFSSNLSPYDEALQSLEKLRHNTLQGRDDIKLYHTQLGLIFKRYISRKQHTDRMNYTTGDLLILCNGPGFPKECLTDIASALRCGDAVKFARYLPSQIESAECLDKIKDAISFIHNNNT